LAPAHHDGEGDNDAAHFVKGLIVGAGIAHNFASHGLKGPGPYAATAIAAGTIFCLAVLLQRGRVTAWDGFGHDW
jgi:hypothetical protein